MRWQGCLNQKSRYVFLTLPETPRRLALRVTAWHYAGVWSQPMG
jgi:hypothetical protein